MTLVYDTEALTVTMIPRPSYLGLPETVRPMTDEEHVGVAAYAFDVVRVADQAELRDLGTPPCPFPGAARFPGTNPQVVAYRSGAAGLTLTATQLNALLRSTLDALEDVSAPRRGARKGPAPGPLRRHHRRLGQQRLRPMVGVQVRRLMAYPTLNLGQFPIRPSPHATTRTYCPSPTSRSATSRMAGTANDDEDADRADRAYQRRPRSVVAQRPVQLGRGWPDTKPHLVIDRRGRDPACAPVRPARQRQLDGGRRRRLARRLA